ncbi:MAG: saccharopine dehydrogenase NADP-binding domain-containing protein [Proteobacteria bacterium]|nr:saccharopine dehydrogenase NADP-binding domain-containing protein [Pseudomonadota bacterium]MDA1352284.1 saccharopine dehydrogenase NADP-binding domain-containing protein [Pseudomonadota bacterium]
MESNREFDIVVYGATGFTGRLVAEYLHRQYGVNGEVKWAMAGRSIDKLVAVRDEMGVGSDVPLVVADADDIESVKKMVASTSVVLTTVGPYQLYGNELVAACAAQGTDYVDLCGEPAWMHKMIAEHSATAEKSGARIVFSCGFDSIPFDLGVFFLQQHAVSALGSTVTRVKGRVRAMKGSMSGGTLASFRATMEAAGRDRSLIGVLRNPFALTSGFEGAEQPLGNKPEYDQALQSWIAPFVMASINTKNVHRSNLLLGHHYGEDFVYDEMMVTGPGEKGEAIAKAISEDTSMAKSTIMPGEGPCKEERENGLYDVLMVGEHADGRFVRVSVKGDRDPGYGSTSKMIAESAVCLVKNPQLASGGIWTTAPVMGAELIERLQANAGLTFTVES